MVHENLKETIVTAATQRVQENLEQTIVTAATQRFFIEIISSTIHYHT